MDKRETSYRLRRNRAIENGRFMIARGYIAAWALLACLALPVFGQTPPPEGNPDDPWAACTIYRDGWGVPHIAAENPRALGFAFGYAQAEDHLEAMLRAYRIVNGRAASVWGEDFAESDAFSLRMGHAKLAETALSEADAFTAELCLGFAHGINAYLLEHPGETPDWADGAQPRTCWRCGTLS